MCQKTVNIEMSLVSSILPKKDQKNSTFLLCYLKSNCFRSFFGRIQEITKSTDLYKPSAIKIEMIKNINLLFKTSKTLPLLSDLAGIMAPPLLLIPLFPSLGALANAERMVRSGNAA